MRNKAEIRGFSRFASPIALEPHSPAPLGAEQTPRLRVSDALAYHPEWNIAAAPGTTGEHHVVITPKSADAHSLSTEAPETVEVVVQNFLTQENGVLTFSHDPDSDAKLRFDLYALPHSTFPIETVVRNERDTKHPEALPFLESHMAHATTGFGIWESAELLSQDEAAKKLRTPVQGLVFATETSNSQIIATLLSDIDNAYQEVYEDSQDPTINDTFYKQSTPQTPEGQEWQADFRYLNPNQRQEHEVAQNPDYSTVSDMLSPAYNLTLFRHEGQTYIILHPQLEPAEIVPSSLPSSGNIFTHVGKIFNQQELPHAA